MHKLVSAAAAAAAIISCAHAQAQDTRFYAGMTTGSSKASLENSAGERFTSTNHPVPIKIYGGLELTERFAVEAGYAGATDKHAFDKGLTGSQNEARLGSQVVYVAAKATMSLADSVDVYGKAGVAHSRYEMEGAGAGDFKISGTRPMAGVGLAYKLSDQFAVTFELEHYGRVRERQISLTTNRLHLGAKFSF